MSDLLLLGLIGALTLLLLLTLLAFAGYSGLLAGVAVSAGSPPIRNVTMAYKFHMGPYSETGRLFTEGCSVSPKLRSIAVYYDNPHMVRSLLYPGWGSAPWADVGQGLLRKGCFGFWGRDGKIFELAMQTTSTLSLKLLTDLVWTSDPGIHRLAGFLFAQVWCPWLMAICGFLSVGGHTTLSPLPLLGL